MSGAQCPKLVRGRVGRFTKVDRCGAIVPGPLNEVVTEGLISVTSTPVYYTPNAIQLPNAAGTLMIDENPRPQFRRLTVDIQCIGVDPILIPLLANQESWASVDPDIASGFTIGDDMDEEEWGFAAELWSGVYGDVCEDGTETWGYFLEPRLKGGQVGPITWANDAINFSITGAQTVAPNDWGVGWHNVTLDENGDPSPLLQSLGTRKHFLMDVVTLAPPTADCGGGPVGQAATGATAGTPGTFTPANSWAPDNLAGMSGVTASPLTAWTTGQYVELGDGSLAHWNSTTWVAGAA